MAPSTAAQLKEEGNALFVQKHFACAYEKYSEAIAVDDQNAVLYANRSACSLGMGKFLDASRDARQATHLDPTYAKGWSRLASAHDASMEFTSAVGAWQMALNALPKADLSPAEVKQKEQYTTSLQKAKERLEAASSRPFQGIVTNCETEKPPWKLAEEMLPELEAAGPAQYHSSAYVIHFANQEFMAGVKRMGMLKRVPMKATPGGFALFGHTEALACISNALMRDLRVFRFESEDWLNKYNGQVIFEAEKHRAWTSEGLENIQKLALQRLKKDGWNDVRPALSIVVRGWIMRAIFDSQLKQAPQIAIERLKETLELLHWGRQIWRDVSKDDRGVVFESTFVTGVKSIYLETLMAVHEKMAEPDKSDFLDTLLAAARELANDMQKAGPPSPSYPVDPGFILSFYAYPMAEAHSTIGYCLVQRAQTCDDPEEKKKIYSLAVGEYSQAARMLPPDDEKHCWYLNCTIDPMLRAEAPKRVVMGVVDVIRKSMPLMQRIWAHSALAKQGRDAMIETTLRIAESKYA